MTDASSMAQGVSGRGGRKLTPNLVRLSRNADISTVPNWVTHFCLYRPVSTGQERRHETERFKTIIVMGSNNILPTWIDGVTGQSYNTPPKPPERHAVRSLLYPRPQLVQSFLGAETSHAGSEANC